MKRCLYKQVREFVGFASDFKNRTGVFKGLLAVPEAEVTDPFLGASVLVYGPIAE